MIRIVRTRTLAALREDLAEADAETLTTQAEADRWNGLYVEECDRADAESDRAERLLLERDQALAEAADLRQQLAARTAAEQANTPDNAADIASVKEISQ